MQIRSERRPKLLMQIMETRPLKCDVDLTTVQSDFVFCYQPTLATSQASHTSTALLNYYLH